MREIDIEANGLILPLAVTNGGLAVVVPKWSVSADAVPMASVLSSRTVRTFLMLIPCLASGGLVIRRATAV
nr:Uncharacterised protein [Klebsiella pneumoniae]